MRLGSGKTYSCTFFQMAFRIITQMQKDGRKAFTNDRNGEGGDKSAT